jgi:Sulfatase-modifying factor enzyme 1/TIR domain/NACHT domain
VPSSPPSPTSLTGLRIFISYPRGGAAHTWAERVELDLRQRGAEPFRDENSIAPGDTSWYQRIDEGLITADAMAFLLGQDTVACRWQQREMLRADSLALPVVVLRLNASAEVPLALIEKQAVELRDGAQAAALDTLAQQLAAQARRRPAERGDAGPPAGAQRQRECAHLNELIHSALSTHEESYVPVAGLERRAPTLARSLKGLRVDTQSLLKTFRPNAGGADAGPDLMASAAEPVPYDDVLDAYLGLPQRRIRRLAVLGEPGAGKSFSLERVAVHHARAALADAGAPLPVLVKLGLWTRPDEGLQAFIHRQLGLLGGDFNALRDARRAVLLLDGLNEIPPGQRQHKAVQLRQMAEDERYAAVLVSCRERDFQDDFDLPFDRLSLLPLTPMQVHRYLHKVYVLDQGAKAGAAVAEQRFWQMAASGGVTAGTASGADGVAAGGVRSTGGASRDGTATLLQSAWAAWQAAGASFEQFWTAEDIPREKPNVYQKTSGEQDAAWREARYNRRSLLALAANPYLLTVILQVIASLQALPSNRAQLFEYFLANLHARERKAREDQHDGASVPEPSTWHAALAELAEALQRAPSTQGQEPGAGTSLPRAACPASLTEPLLKFSIDASVLQRAGADVRFTHQLLQESLASRVLLAASDSAAARPASDFWPASHWWQRNGWEVVAELAAESCAGDDAATLRLLAWLAQAQPEVAVLAWQTRKRHATPQALPPELTQQVMAQWAPVLTEALRLPAPQGRAAIGRALAAWGLDQRPGIGLRPNGLPDIAWVPINSSLPFIYQGKKHKALPPFALARYPVTNAQYQAFIDAGGYGDARWWQDMPAAKPTARPAPLAPRWPDANAPRETVSWYEAMAYGRWLSAATGLAISLPTERQWERAASGSTGREFPWEGAYRTEQANCDDREAQYNPELQGAAGNSYIGRTSAVGIYPGASAEGLDDLAGNVWEWCADRYEPNDSKAAKADPSRVLRGGSWDYDARGLRAAQRGQLSPDNRDSIFIGFRLCCVSPIE